MACLARACVQDRTEILLLTVAHEMEEMEAFENAYPEHMADDDDEYDGGSYSAESAQDSEALSTDEMPSPSEDEDEQQEVYVAAMHALAQGPLPTVRAQPPSP